MQIYISKSYSSVLSTRSKDELELLKKIVSDLKDKNKTAIIEMDNVIVLSKDKDIILYALNMQDNKYIVFSFKEKNTMVLLDEIALISNDEIQSLVYPNEINNVQP